VGSVTCAETDPLRVLKCPTGFPLLYFYYSGNILNLKAGQLIVFRKIVTNVEFIIR